MSTHQLNSGYQEYLSSRAEQKVETGSGSFSLFLSLVLSLALYAVLASGMSWLFKGILGVPILLLVLLSLFLAIDSLRRVRRNAKSARNTDLSDFTRFIVTEDIPKAIDDADFQKFERLITEANVSINALEKDGRTILMMAVERGDLDFLSRLFSSYGDIEVDDKNLVTRDRLAPTTALGVALAANNQEAVDFLLEQGASVRAGTPLRQAAMHCDVEVVLKLLEKGADPNKKRPLSLAVERRKFFVAQALLKAGADPNSGKPLVAATKANDPALVNELIRFRANPEIEEDGFTPGWEDVAFILAQGGAKVIHVTHVSQTHYASGTVNKCGHCGDQSALHAAKGVHCPRCGSYWNSLRPF